MAKSSSSGAIPFLTVGKNKYVRATIITHYKLHQTTKARQKIMNTSFECEKTNIKYHLISQLTFYFWSITPLHFTNAGIEGKTHFNFLMNLIILDINQATVLELNTFYVLLLRKVQGKLKTSDRSYRTISCCSKST